MKSAYGHVAPKEDVALTHVEAGSPMGELLRRYWQPVALSDELVDLPKRVQHPRRGPRRVPRRRRAGPAASICIARIAAPRWNSVVSSRAASVAAITAGSTTPADACTDMPCETAEFLRADAGLSSRLIQPASIGGLVFVYMGPPEQRAGVPALRRVRCRLRDDVVLRGMKIWGEYSIGYVKDCNWLQHYENVVDPWHLLILHQANSGEQFRGAMVEGVPRIAFEKTALGVRYNIVRDLPNGNRFVRHAECVLPNIFLVPNLHEPGTAPRARTGARKFRGVCRSTTSTSPRSASSRGRRRTAPQERLAAAHRHCARHPAGDD